MRIHAANRLFETENLSNEEYRNASGDRNSYDNLIHAHSMNKPESYGFLYSVRELFNYYRPSREVGGTDFVTRLLMTEAYATPEAAVPFYGSSQVTQGANVPMNSQLLTDIDSDSDAQDFKAAIDSWIDAKPVWGTQSNWMLGNQDTPRVAYRFGDRSKEGLAMMSLLLPGVNIMYYVSRFIFFHSANPK